MRQISQQRIPKDLIRGIPVDTWPVFRSLLRAHDCAITAASDVWEFAVELSVLYEMVDRTDLRWLIKKDLLIHARETTRSTDKTRRFAHNPSLRFVKQSCFILSDQGVAVARTINVGSRKQQDVQPRWDSCRHELWLGEAMVKKFKVPSRNQETVLAAFDEEDWPPSIFDPLSPHPEISAKRRLHDTIKGLNRNQKTPVMRFHGDGTGEAVLWEVVGDDELVNITASARNGHHSAQHNEI